MMSHLVPNAERGASIAAVIEALDMVRKLEGRALTATVGIPLWTSEHGSFEIPENDHVPLPSKLVSAEPSHSLRLFFENPDLYLWLLDHWEITPTNPAGNPTTYIADAIATRYLYHLARGWVESRVADIENLAVDLLNDLGTPVPFDVLSEYLTGRGWAFRRGDSTREEPLATLTEESLEGTDRIAIEAPDSSLSVRWRIDHK